MLKQTLATSGSLRQDVFSDGRCYARWLKNSLTEGATFASDEASLDTQLVIPWRAAIVGDDAVIPGMKELLRRTGGYTGLNGNFVPG